MKVIVVEDEVDLKTIILRLLLSVYPNAEVDWVTSAEKAVERLDSERPYDVIMSDIILTGKVTGVDLWRTCQSRFPNTPFVFMSGLPADFYLHLLQGDKRCPPFLSKPFTTQEFQEIFRSLARGLATTALPEAA